MDASRKVKRCFPGNYALVPSEIKDDAMQTVDTSSSELRMRACRPMHCRPVTCREANIGDRTAEKSNVMNPSWQPTSSSLESSPENEHLILAQKRAATDRNSEFKVSQDEDNSVQQSKRRKKGKELERNANHRQSFIVAGPSRSNWSMMKPRMERNAVFCSRVLQGKVDQFHFNGVPSGEVQFSHLHFDHNHATKEKGKVDLENDTQRDKQDAERMIESNRLFFSSGKEMVTIAEEYSSFASRPNLMCSKPHDFDVNMLNHLSPAHPIKYKEKNSSSYMPEWGNGANIGDNDHLSFTCKGLQIIAQDHISNPTYGRAFSEPVSVSRRNNNCKENVKGQKKCKSLHSEFGDLYPEVRCSRSHGQQSSFSDNSNARVSQVESDEIFARELQEQFYHETAGFIDIEKVDAKIAQSLQNDEDAKAAALAWQGQSADSLQSLHQSSSLFESNSSTPDHAIAQRNLDYVDRYPEMVMFEKFGISLNNEVDLDTRLDLLEAVEDMLETNYMFDTDYEDSSNHVESNHPHVGSSEINSLPISVVQKDDNEEACAVCLDVPSSGEIMRHLPCLHRFHRMCIDKWLKRKPSCPVCKFSIT